MNNWADTMIIQYEEGRKELKEHSRELSENIDNLTIGRKPEEISNEDWEIIEKDQLDKTRVNSMVNDMTFVIEWLETGREPGKFRGIDKNSVYQTNSLTQLDSISDMDMFPSLEIKPTERKLTEEEKNLIFKSLRKLSPRERQVFVFRYAYLWELESIADELGIGVGSVKSYLFRAKKKLSCQLNAIAV